MVLRMLVDKGAAGRVRSLPHIISLMSEKELRRPILEGAITSIGGVDMTLCQAAANALVAMVLTPDLRVTSIGSGPREGAPSNGSA
jgi:Tubulin folding cofactor D C terminal